MRRSLTITGFTLAEVLITLTIIGVIAALTIPALITDVQDAQFKTAYRKAFSVANQAITKAYTNNQLNAMTGLGDPVNMHANFNAFMNQFVVTKTCINDAYNCWNASGEFMNSPSNRPDPTSSAFVDNSGMVWTMYSGSAEGEAMIMVDTNGSNNPNRYGKDRWSFKLVDINGARDSGIPIRIVPYVSDATSSSNICHYPPCYFVSWLKQ